MNSKHFLFVALLALFPVTTIFSQEEDPEEFEADLREHFNVLGEELNEQLGEMLEEVSHVTEELNQAKAEGEESEAVHVSIDLTRLEVGLAAWQDLLAQHKKMMALAGEDFLEEEGPLNRALDKAHRQRDIAEAKADIGHLETELRFLEREEGSKEFEDELERRLQIAREQLESRLELMAAWERVDAAWAEGREEEAEELEKGLWLRERDLSFRLDGAEIKSRAVEAAERMNDLRKEMLAAEQEAHMAKELIKYHVQVVQSWERIKGALENANEEQRDELLEQFYHLEEKYHLQREIMEVRLNIARAKAFGDTDEVEELARHLEEMEQEAQEQEDR